MVGEIVVSKIKATKVNGSGNTSAFSDESEDSDDITLLPKTKLIYQSKSNDESSEESFEENEWELEQPNLPKKNVSLLSSTVTNEWFYFELQVFIFLFYLKGSNSSLDIQNPSQLDANGSSSTSNSDDESQEMNRSSSSSSKVLSLWMEAVRKAIQCEENNSEKEESNSSEEEEEELSETVLYKNSKPAFSDDNDYSDSSEKEEHLADDSSSSIAVDSCVESDNSDDFLTLPKKRQMSPPNSADESSYSDSERDQSYLPKKGVSMLAAMVIESFRNNYPFFISNFNLLASRISIHQAFLARTRSHGI